MIVNLAGTYKYRIITNFGEMAKNGNKIAIWCLYTAGLCTNCTLVCVNEDEDNG